MDIPEMSPAQSLVHNTGRHMEVLKGCIMKYNVQVENIDFACIQRDFLNVQWRPDRALPREVFEAWRSNSTKWPLPLSLKARVSEATRTRVDELALIAGKAAIAFWKMSLIIRLGYDPATPSFYTIFTGDRLKRAEIVLLSELENTLKGAIGGLSLAAVERVSDLEYNHESRISVRQVGVRFLLGPEADRWMWYTEFMGALVEHLMSVAITAKRVQPRAKAETDQAKLKLARNQLSQLKDWRPKDHGNAASATAAAATDGAAPPPAAQHPQGNNGRNGGGRGRGRGRGGRGGRFGHNNRRFGGFF